MKPTHRMAAAAAAIVLACGATGAIGYAKSLRASAKESAPPAERGGFSLNKLDRGNTRSLYGSASLAASNDIAQVQIAADTEVDATSVVFTTYSSTAAAGSAVNMYFSQFLGGLAYPCNTYMKAHDTVTFNFSPPLRLRTGDTINAGAIGEPGADGIRAEVSVFGYIPSAVRTEGMTVQ